MAAANVAGQGGRSEAFGQYHTLKNNTITTFHFLETAHQYCGGNDVDDEADNSNQVGGHPHGAEGYQPIPISGNVNFKYLDIKTSKSYFCMVGSRREAQEEEYLCSFSFRSSRSLNLIGIVKYTILK